MAGGSPSRAGARVFTRTHDPVEADVVSDARAGDEEAFSRIYHLLEKRVRRTAFRLIGDAHEAEDTVQDAFFDAYRSLPTLVDVGAFEAWLLRIVKNRAVDRRRDLRRSRTSERAADDSSDHDPGLPRVLRRTGVAEPPPFVLVLLRSTIDELSPQLREALRLRYESGLSCEEIALREGLSVAAVKTRLCRARSRLRSALLPAWRRRVRGVKGRESVRCDEPPVEIRDARAQVLLSEGE